MNWNSLLYNSILIWYYSSESRDENDIPCSTAKGIESEIKENEKDMEEGSDDQSTLNQNPGIIPTEKIEDNKNERLTEEECNDQTTSNQSTEVDVDNTSDENKASVPNTDQGSSSSTQVPIREKCKYGSQCYR